MTSIIVMATFNAGPYLRPQLSSLQSQSEKDWMLLISDDGSSDGTLEVLREVCSSDNRCRLLPTRRGAAGSCANFEHLLETAAQEVSSQTSIFLCDQDDIWAPGKIAAQRELLATASGCYSDAALIGESGAAEPGTLLTGLRAHGDPDIASQLAQNSVLGCSFALRAEVLELALPFPPGLVNHDWWLALCAQCLHGLQRSEDLLLSYRQHESNEVGGYRPGRQWRRLPILLKRQQRVLAGQRRAAEYLRWRLEERGLPAPDALGDYAATLRKTPLARSLALLKGPYAANHSGLRWLRAVAALAL